ncbi:hypothetical protein [Aneurinibacillus migulanus]|uniref:hypothetical protein n=1 Tax=Aneurinibacillus migulanus TaxID=47500 RepID=UPI001F318542|nr:hypothetical protein [Aneurinibacillus migulanus]
MIHRQILVVRGKKRRKGGERERSEKDTLPFLLLERIPNLLLPTTFLCQNIKCNLYRVFSNDDIQKLWENY